MVKLFPLNISVKLKYLSTEENVITIRSLAGHSWTEAYGTASHKHVERRRKGGEVSNKNKKNDS